MSASIVFLRRLALLAAALPGIACAQDVLVRNATVHTATARGTLTANDVLVQGGVIRAIGPATAASSRSARWMAAPTR